MSTKRFTYTQLISLICIHTYMHMHTGGRWWERAVMAYIVLNIQLGPMLDEDLHHLQMAFRCGLHEQSPFILSETDTHSERHHGMPPHTTHIQTTIFMQTYIHTIIQYAYSKTLAHPYLTACIHTVWV